MPKSFKQHPRERFIEHVFVCPEYEDDMDALVAAWHDSGLLGELMRHKLVFIETTDVVETSLALDNFRRACNAGRGALFAGGVLHRACGDGVGEGAHERAVQPLYVGEVAPRLTRSWVEPEL